MFPLALALITTANHPVGVPVGIFTVVALADDEYVTFPLSDERVMEAVEFPVTGRIRSGMFV